MLPARRSAMRSRYCSAAFRSAGSLPPNVAVESGVAGNQFALVRGDSAAGGLPVFEPQIEKREKPTVKRRVAHLFEIGHQHGAELAFRLQKFAGLRRGRDQYSGDCLMSCNCAMFSPVAQQARGVQAR